MPQMCFWETYLSDFGLYAVLYKPDDSIFTWSRVPDHFSLFSDDHFGQASLCLSLLILHTARELQTNAGYRTTNADAGVGIGMKRGVRQFEKNLLISR